MSNQSEKTVTQALTAEGALLIADGAVYDHSDLYRIALKTLAQEYRVMRAQRDLAVVDGQERVRAARRAERAHVTGRADRDLANRGVQEAGDDGAARERPEER